MANTPDKLNWGKTLKGFREKVGLSQGEFINRLSSLLQNISGEERRDLEEIGIYNELVDFFGGILDTAMLSRLETGKRELRPRSRHLAFIWGLKQLGSLQSAEEANNWLELGREGNLSLREHEVIFGGTQTLSLPTKNQNLRIGVAIVLVLAIAAMFSIWYLQPSNENIEVSPVILDDFSSREINTNDWNTAKAPHASIDNDRLLFDIPLNSSDEWYSEELEYRGEINHPISRIKFTIIGDTAETYPSGAFGVSTGCLNDEGWMNIHVGETPSHLYLEYAESDEIGTGSLISLTGIEQGRAYEVDLEWRSDGLQISVDGNRIDHAPVPCNATTYFSLSANVDVHESVRGFIDRIEIWY